LFHRSVKRETAEALVADNRRSGASSRARRLNSTSRLGDGAFGALARASVVALPAASLPDASAALQNAPAALQNAPGKAIGGRRSAASSRRKPLRWRHAQGRQEAPVVSPSRKT
jgi:hypothetical protein